MRKAHNYLGAYVGALVFVSVCALGAHAERQYEEAHEPTSAPMPAPTTRTQEDTSTHTEADTQPTCTSASTRGKAGIGGTHVRMMDGCEDAPTCSIRARAHGMCAPTAPSAPTYEDETYVLGTDGTAYPAIRCNAEDEVLAPIEYGEDGTRYVCTHIDNL